MLDISPQIMITAAICFARIGAVVFALPLLGDPAIPVRARIAVSLALSLCILPTIPNEWGGGVPDSLWSFALVIMKELIIGLLIGFSARLLFEGTVMAASLVGYQMGFGTANLLVADAQIQMSSFTAMHRIIVILIFFALNLHHVFIGAIVETFRHIPAGLALPHSDLGHLLVQGTAGIFSVAIQLAAPILVALLFAMAALGLIARTVPQLNVFTMSFPISFMVGLSIYVSMTPFLTGWLREHFEKTTRLIYLTIQGLITA